MQEDFLYEDIVSFVDILISKSNCEAFSMVSDLIHDKNTNLNFICDIFKYIIKHYNNFVKIFGIDDLNTKYFRKCSLLESAMKVNNINLIDIIMNYYKQNKIDYNDSMIYQALGTPSFKYMVEKYNILNRYNQYTDMAIIRAMQYSLSLINKILWKDNNDIFALHTIFNHIYFNYIGHVVNDDIDITNDGDIDEIGLMPKIIIQIIIETQYDIMFQFIEQNIQIIYGMIENYKNFIYKILLTIIKKDKNKQKFDYIIDKFIIELNKDKYKNENKIIKKILYDVYTNNNYQLLDGMPYFDDDGNLDEYTIIGKDMLLFDGDELYMPYISNYILNNIIYYKLYLCNHILINKDNELMQYIDSIYYMKNKINDIEFIEFLQKLIPLVIQEGTYEQIIETIDILYSLQPDLNIISDKIICNYCEHCSVKCNFNKKMINRLIGSPNNMCEKIILLCNNMECIHNYINIMKTDITLQNIEKNLKNKKGFPIEIRYYISKFIKNMTTEEYKNFALNPDITHYEQFDPNQFQINKIQQIMNEFDDDSDEEIF